MDKEMEELVKMEKEVEELIVRGLFEDLLVLAERFWDYPQKLRLHILARTSVNPFVIRNNFVTFFRAFGFTTYFEKYAGLCKKTGEVLMDASREKRWRAIVDNERDLLIEKMINELREIVTAPRLLTVENVASLPELKSSFCKNTVRGVFVSPMSLPGWPDHEIVSSSVRQFAMRLKYPEIDDFF